MPTEILMPALSPTMEEGKLAKWLVKEGQTIKPGDIIAEIETDKATMEVEAVDEGKVGQDAGGGGTEGVKVNTPIATLLAGRGERRRGGRPSSRPQGRVTSAPPRVGACQSGDPRRRRGHGAAGGASKPVGMRPGVPAPPGEGGGGRGRGSPAA